MQYKEFNQTATSGCVIFFYSEVLAGMPSKDKIVDIEISELDLYIINKVRELRVARNISQVELAQRMGLSDGVIAKIERPSERAKYNIRHLNLLAKALNCSPRDLLPEKPLPNDIIISRVKVVRNPFGKKGEPNYQVISKKPLKD